jgi:hypothetical protein
VYGNVTVGNCGDDADGDADSDGSGVTEDDSDIDEDRDVDALLDAVSEVDGEAVGEVDGVADGDACTAITSKSKLTSELDVACWCTSTAITFVPATNGAGATANA